MSIQDKKRIAVVVPVYKKTLTTDEQISLNHLYAYLDDYDHVMVGPPDIGVQWPGFKNRCFDKKYFRSVETYSSLLVSKCFYEAFQDYEYILIYQLDCLVFFDKLLDWCNEGYDYIGAPWLKQFKIDWIDEDVVGNGGFSLRRVRTCLDVLSVCRDWKGFVGNRKDMSKHFRLPSTSSWPVWSVQAACKAMDMIRKGHSIRSVIEKAKDRIAIRTNRAFISEDYFWSFEAKKYVKEYRVPKPMVALSFSFEMEPRLSLHLNHGDLPFGCHAWAKYDRDFWEQHLIIKSPTPKNDG